MQKPQAPPKEQLKIVTLKIPVTDPSELTPEIQTAIQNGLDGLYLHRWFPNSAEPGMIVAEIETFVIK